MLDKPLALLPALLPGIPARGQEEDRRRSAQAGFDRHLVKPVDPEVLQAPLAAL